MGCGGDSSPYRRIWSLFLKTYISLLDTELHIAQNRNIQTIKLVCRPDNQNGLNPIGHYFAFIFHLLDTDTCLHSRQHAICETCTFFKPKNFQDFVKNQR